jgi:elongator complex protein 1
MINSLRYYQADFCIREEDVTQTIYKDTTVQQSTVVAATPRNNNVDGMPIDATKDSKVNRICDAFLAVLASRFSTNLQNVITAHVCKVPPNIEAGLDVVSNLRESQPDMADSAVEHICFLADVNRVYDAAIGMYSLDLALLVAQQSQKDPREYLPYMQSLQGLSELRRRFTIDDDLGRHRKALQHLYELKVVEEVQLYTQKHSLYTEALDLYRYDTTSQSLIMQSYASHLHSRNRYKEAAIAYTFLSDHASASSSYRLANLWSPCLTSALLANLPAEELTALAESLVDHLTETHDHSSAAIIHHQHLSDLPSALRSLCRAHAFTHATRLAALNSRPDLISGILDPGLIDASATLTELLADMKAQLHAQVPRLRDLRKLKAADPLAFFEGMVTGAEDVPDNVSIAPSATSTVGGASLFTRYGNGTQAGGNKHGTSTINTTTTRKTSKNRRREERKRARGKKGSVYEEEYLVMSVGRLVERINEVAADVTETVEGLLSRGMRERARAVEGAMAEVVAVCEAVVGEVWEVDISGKNVALDGEEGVEEGGGGARPAGADGVLWESLGQQWKKIRPPAVRKFEPSGLL